MGNTQQIQKTSGKCSIYENVFDKTSQYTIKISDALNRIKTGKSAKSVITLRNESNSDRQKYLKDSTLPSITFSGIFSIREDASLVSHSGFICLDFDDVNVDEYKDKFRNWKYCYAVWVSPRGAGVKVLLKIKDGKKHREHYTALKNLFPNVDPHCINESRVCYESYDPEIYINEESETFNDIYEIPKFEKKEVSIEKYEIYKKLVGWAEKKFGFVSGNRNNFVFLLGGAMCRYGIPENDCCEFILEDYTQSDFSHKEIVRAIQSGYKKNESKFGTVIFKNETLFSKEDGLEVSPDILQDGYILQDVIYGSDVLEGALDILKSGYKTAETTHIDKLDEYFRFKKGELTVLSGVGNYGKSYYLYQILLIKSYFNGDKWAIFSPEHYPAEEFYFDFTEMLLGCSCDGSSIPENIFLEAYKFVAEHFFYIFSETIDPTPKYIRTKFSELIIKEGVTGVVIDPFNQMANDYGNGRTDKYLETFLSECKRFAQLNDVFYIIVCHPVKLQKGADGNYPCPDVFDLADGAMWNNKADNILIYHRPVAQTSPDLPLCEHHSKKIKRQKHKVKKGDFRFELNRATRRFLFDGKNPLDGNKFEYNFQRRSDTPTINPDKFIEPKEKNILHEELDAPF